MISILRRGLVFELTSENCIYSSNLMFRYGNRYGRFTRCVMCGVRWRWDEVMGCWFFLLVFSRSLLLFSSRDNIFLVVTASKVKVKNKAKVKVKAIFASFSIRDFSSSIRIR